MQHGGSTTHARTWLREIQTQIRGVDPEGRDEEWKSGDGYPRSAESSAIDARRMGVPRGKGQRSESIAPDVPSLARAYGTLETVS